MNILKILWNLLPVNGLGIIGGALLFTLAIRIFS